MEHAAEVTAESLYEAGALALLQFQRKRLEPRGILDAGSLRVQVCESIFHNVKVAEVEAWLRRTGGVPREVSLRRGIQNRIAKSTWRAVLIAGDGDYVPLVEEVKRHGKLVLCMVL